MLFMVPLSVSTSVTRSSFERDIGKELAREVSQSTVCIGELFVNELGRLLTSNASI